MSSGGSGAFGWRAGLAVLAGMVSAPIRAQEDGAGDPLTAQAALEAARDAYVPGEQRVEPCPENTVEANQESKAGDVIIVCRRLVPEYEFQTRDGPSPELNRTADGVPRAPDLTTIPSCIPGQGLVCMKFGRVPPPVLMVDVTKFPEPLSPEDAALVFRVPDEDAPPPEPLTGKRVPILFP